MQTPETDYIMREVENRFSMLEDSFDDFRKEIRDTFLAMEHSLESLKLKMMELQTELMDWQDDIPPGSISRH